MGADPYRPTDVDEPLRVYPLRVPLGRVLAQWVVAAGLFVLLLVLGAARILDDLGRGVVPLVMALAVAMGVSFGSTLPLLRRRFRSIELHADRMVLVGRTTRTTFPLAGLRVTMRTTSAGSEVVAGRLVARPPVPLSLGLASEGKWVEVDTALLPARTDAREIAEAVARVQRGDAPTDAFPPMRMRIDESASELDGDRGEVEETERSNEAP